MFEVWSQLSDRVHTLGGNPLMSEVVSFGVGAAKPAVPLAKSGGLGIKIVAIRAFSIAALSYNTNFLRFGVGFADW